MNWSIAALIGAITLIFAVAVATERAVKSSYAEAARSCRQAGGSPLRIAGDPVCFAPGVIINHKETPQ